MPIKERERYREYYKEYNKKYWEYIPTSKIVTARELGYNSGTD